MLSQFVWFILSLIVFLTRPFLRLVGQTKKLHGVYSQPSILYWPKFYLMRFLIVRQQKKRNESKQVYRGDLYRMTRKDRAKAFDSILLDRKQVLPEDLPYAGDCIFFNGANERGCYLSFGFAQRRNDIANVFFVLKTCAGTFVNEELLCSSNVKTKPHESVYQTISGFQVRCLEPMKRWHLKFNGSLVRASELHQNLNMIGEDQPNENAQRYHCIFDWTWEAIGDWFNFDTDVCPGLIAHSLALEPWSLSMFKKLESSHQTHYEQFGKLSGDVFIDDQRIAFEITSMRDHTIAPYRRWTDLRRYIMIMFHLEDGTCINSMAVSMPDVVFTHLNFGYVIKPNGSKVPINRLNLQLPFIGEDKHFPDQFEYDFDIEDVQKLMMTVQVNVRERVSFKMGLDLGCFIEELMCDFTVFGKRGYGVVEVEYRIEPY